MWPYTALFCTYLDTLSSHDDPELPAEVSLAIDSYSYLATHAMHSSTIPTCYGVNDDHTPRASLKWSEWVAFRSSLGPLASDSWRFHRVPDITEISKGP